MNELEELKDANIRLLIKDLKNAFLELKMEVVQLRGNSDSFISEAIKTLQSRIEIYLKKETEKLDKYFDMRIEATHKFLPCLSEDRIDSLDKRVGILENKVKKIDLIRDWWTRKGYKVLIFTVSISVLIIFVLLVYIAFIKNGNIKFS
jgi:hypothetical protein